MLSVNIELVAQIAHEANRAYCQSIGDNSQVEWQDAPEWQRESAIIGVKYLIDNPEATPANSHECWLAVKRADGWVYGPEKNPEKKEHPCMVEYSDLPEFQKNKDHLYLSIVNTLKPYIFY